MSVTEATIDLASFAEQIGSDGPGRGRGRAHPMGRRRRARSRARGSCRHPTGIAWIAVEEMTVCCGAGTLVTELDAALAERGQCVALPDWHGATVGGVLAVGRSGIRRLGYGPVRDALLQARFVSAEGRIVKAGGPTVKNVSGYDLCRLLVGSLGTVGLIGEVILRTRPLPAASRWFAIETADAVGRWLPRCTGRRACCGTATPRGFCSRVTRRTSRRRSSAAGLRGSARAARAAGAPLVDPADRGHRIDGHVRRRGRRRRRAPHRATTSSRRWTAVVADLTSRIRDRVRPDAAPQPGPRRARCMKLGVVDDELAACVACGLCLPHCPTYRVTGEEAASPRGRIAAMREVHWEGAEPDDAFVGFMDACVQCRGCETACPSSVPFGRLMEGHARLARRRGRFTPWWQRLGMKALGHHGLAAGRVAGARRRAAGPSRAEARLAAAPRRAGAAASTLAARAHRQRRVAVHRLRDGRVAAPGPRRRHPGARPRAGSASRCPARAATAAARCTCTPASPTTPDAWPDASMGSMPGTRADRRRLRRLRRRAEGLRPPARHARRRGVLGPRPRRARVARAAHGRAAAARRALVVVASRCRTRATSATCSAPTCSVRTVLQPYVEVVELDDEGLCCGAGGAYSALHPEMAGAIRERKVAAIVGPRRDVVASANPGCALHLAAAGVAIRHPMEIVDEALDGR